MYYPIRTNERLALKKMETHFKIVEVDRDYFVVKVDTERGNTIAVWCTATSHIHAYIIAMALNEKREGY